MLIRKIVLIVLILIGTLSMYGCNSNQSITNVQKSAQSKNEITLSTRASMSKTGGKNNVNNEIKQVDKLNSIEKRIMEIKAKPNGPDLLEKLVILGGTGQIAKTYKDLSSNLMTNLMNSRSIDYLESSYGKKRKIKVRVYDENNKPVDGVKVYLWGYLIGQTDKKGELVKIIKIPRVYDYMYFQAYKPGYLWGFKKINAINLDGSLISVTFKLKRDIVKEVDNIDKFEVKDKKISIIAFTKCLTLTKEGNCYQGKGEIEIGYVDPGERDYLSIPTQAVYNGKLVHLQSNGMAFIKFRDKDGNLLKLNPNFDGSVKICYNVGEKAIQDWNNQRWTLEGKESDGYWWFDKNLGVWKLAKNAKITIKDGKFCFETKHIY